MSRSRETKFGKELNKLRIDLELSLRDFGDKLGFTANYISQVELGKRAVTAVFLNKIERVFGLDAVKMRQLEKAAAENIDCMTIHLADIESRRCELAIMLGRRLESLSDEQVEAIFNVIGSKSQ